MMQLRAVLNIIGQRVETVAQGRSHLLMQDLRDIAIGTGLKNLLALHEWLALGIQTHVNVANASF